MSTLAVDNFRAQSGGSAYSTKGVAKATANYNTVTTTSLTEGNNVGSLTDNGTGDTSVNFTNNMTTANLITGALTVQDLPGGTAHDRDKAAGSQRIVTRNASNVDTDADIVSCIVWADLA